MTVKLRIDGIEIEVARGATIMDAADACGIRIPRLCHHPRLTPSASCRICAVEVAGREGLVMSCAEEAVDGMEVRTSTEAVRRSREDVLEFMLANHPVDCPVCDRAGECDLQDCYFEHSGRPSRLCEPKVRKPKAVRIGPHVVLDAERCIACTRCMRFLEEMAGAHELGLCLRGERTEIGIAPGAALASPYSLCTVDLCPVGALTSWDFRFKKRAWMLTSSPTVCPGCSRGCSAWLDHADGRAFRLRPRENAKVNGEWMCDEGRMTYKALDPARRLTGPLVLEGGELVKSDWEGALARAASLIRPHGKADVVCILSARASVEENRAMADFSRDVLKSRLLFFSGDAPDPGFSDEWLRCEDRNPNTGGASSIAAGRLGDIPAGSGAIVLETPSPGDIIRLMASRPAWVVLLTSCGEGLGRWPDVVLPRLTHFEQDGTFICEGGREQKFEKAIDCETDAQSACEAARRLALALCREGSRV